MLCITLLLQAQSIGFVEPTKNWLYVYDQSGKKIHTAYIYNKELKGYSSSFYILKEGNFYNTYTPLGKRLHSFYVNNTGEVIGVAGDTFTCRYGHWLYTWSKDGKKVSTRAAH